jgi:BlaI family transcriptional regulator, penicillinase repressor
VADHLPMVPGHKNRDSPQLTGGIRMKRSSLSGMSRRERQIMEIVYRRGRATAGEIHGEMPDRPSYSTVRTLLRVLEEKGHLRHESDGPRYVYWPCVSAQKAQRSAIEQLLRTFFNNSAVGAMAALLDMSAADLSDAELKRLARLIQQAKEKENSHE